MFIKASSMIGLILLLTACGGGLSDFVRPDESKIVIGESTSADIVTQLQREPDATGNKLVNNTMLNQLEYAYLVNDNATSDTPDEAGFIAVKGQMYYLNANVLVGSDYYSTFANDSTKFDVSKITSIVEGKSTKSDVIKLLGRPSIVMVQPMISKDSIGAIGYHYRTMNLGTPGKLRTTVDRLVVEYDKKNIVTKVTFESKSDKTA